MKVLRFNKIFEVYQAPQIDVEEILPDGILCASPKTEVVDEILGVW